jgi:hypothetical protein
MIKGRKQKSYPAKWQQHHPEFTQVNAYTTGTNVMLRKRQELERRSAVFYQNEQKKNLC